MADFDITPEDFALLDKLSPVIAGRKEPLPPPTLCPLCRQQRRWAVRNERHLYKRTCDHTGQEIISLYAPDSPHKVFKEDVWWSDAWDGLDYGRPFDFSRRFFGQFHDLRLAVPRRGMQQDGTAENSDYTTFVIS